MVAEEERLAGTTARTAIEAFVVESIERNSMNKFNRNDFHNH